MNPQIQNISGSKSTFSSSTPKSQEPLFSLENTTSPQIVFRFNRLGKKCGIPPRPYEVSICDLITKDAKSVVLTTFVLDPIWIFEQCPILLTIPCRIYHGDQNLQDLITKLTLTQSHKVNTNSPPPDFRMKNERITVGANCELIYVKVKTNRNYGIHHGKVGIIEYPGFLRVFVSTSNLIQPDYEAKIQGIWFQDFKLKIQNVERGPFSRSKELSDEFKSTLLKYLHHLDPKLQVEFLHRYSFTNVAVILITSIPGLHRNKVMHQVGIAKFHKWIETNPVCHEHLNRSSRSTVYALFSSIGKITPNVRNDFENAFCLAYSPPNESTPLHNPSSTVSNFKNTRSGSTASNAELKLIWPSVSFVKNCIDGYFAGYELCGNRQRIYASTVIPNLYEYLSRDEAKRQIPPHIKCYYRINSDDQSINWALLTSANLSQSSWGTFQRNHTQLFIANYEVGILFCPWLLEEICDDLSSPNDSSDASKNVVTQTQKINRSPIPVCLFSSDIVSLERHPTHWRVNFPVAFKVPTNPFFNNQALEPWCDDQDFNEQDRNGMVFTGGLVKRKEELK